MNIAGSPSRPAADAATSLDACHMRRALALAERGMATTRPNPRVGCVLAHGERVVGEGWHQRAGGPHAEVFALRQAGSEAAGSTAYVTLEPCAHHGRTPPCADALVEAGVARVVVACEDPNPRVDGRGIDRLRAAGIEVESGLLHGEARELNRGFLSRLERGRPWLRLKLAQSLDGRTALADGRSQWITGAAARADVHLWRAQSCALLTAMGTARFDDPALTVRGFEGDFLPPLRVVLDAAGSLQANARLVDGSAPTLVLHGEAGANVALPDCVEQQQIATRDGRLELGAVLALLADRGINEIQVEAGPTLSGSLLEAGLVDELLLYVAPVLLGDAALPLARLVAPDGLDAARRFALRDYQQLGADVRMLLRPLETS